MSDDFKSFVDDQYDLLRDRLQEVSTFLWKNPELSGKEHQAHDFLSQLLADEGFTVERQYLDLSTSFRASYGTVPGGPTICIVCEYDALPGIGHACGHNLIAQAGIGAGLVIKRYLESHATPGKVVVLGCPAEERGSYKVLMLERGGFKDVDLVMMVHPHSASDELNASLIGKVNFIAKFFGQPAHAAGAPWEGKNALDAAVAAYQALAMLRQQTHPTCKIHAIIPDGGTSVNVIPEFASIEVIVRAPDLPHLRSISEKAENCAKAAALLSDTTLEISKPCPSVLPLKSNQILAGIYQRYAEQMGSEFVDITGRGTRFEASSDIGSVSWEVPTIQPGFHIESDGPNHSREFTTAAGRSQAQPMTIRASKAMALTAINIFNNGQLVELMWAELRK